VNFEWKKIRSEIGSWIVFFVLLIISLYPLFPIEVSKRRTVDSSKVEKCLQVFIQHKKSGDSAWLMQQLKESNIPPAKFEKIIDRFIYYRVRQSALKQAMKLLDAFKAGEKIAPVDVFSKSDETGGSSFALDAEILTVFREKPELVQEAFGG